jgi:hypothetical protein
MRLLKFMASASLGATIARGAGISPLVDGVEFFKDLVHGEVICKTLSVPHSANRVQIKASVVGLTGNPNLFGGWEEREILDRVQSELAPVNAGGYHILSEYHEVPPNRDAYFLCVTTFATQGSDFLLTGTIRDAGSWFTPAIFLMDSYPTVWRLEDSGQDYADFVVPTPGDGKNLTVSVTPYSGEVDIIVSNCEDWLDSLAVSQAAGPDVVSVKVLEGMTRACIRAQTKGSAEFSIVASTDEKGPFLAQSIAVTGSRFRAYFNRDTDLTFTSRPMKKFTITSDSGMEWSSDDHGKVDIHRSALVASESDILTIQLDVSTSMWVTSHGTVEQLEDGIPLEVMVDGENRFRDFRVWIPPEAQSVLIQGDSAGDGSGLGIFASTVRTSHDPRGYRWNTMSGTNEIFLDAKNNLDCTACYLYVSVKSCTVKDGACDPSNSPSLFILTVSTDVNPLHLIPNYFFKTMGSSSLKLAPTQSGSLIILGNVESVSWTTALETNVCSDQPSGVCKVPVVDQHTLFLGRASGLVQVAFTTETDPYIYLRNHQEIKGSANPEDSFKLKVPEGTLSLIDFSSSESGTMTVCMDADCQSVTSSGIIHLQPGLVSIKITGPASYSLTPSFFSPSSNSLRVNYHPVKLQVSPLSKSFWEIGYDPLSEWLVSASESTSPLEMCIADPEDVRCCSVPCTLQGFGREQIWIENKADTPVVVKLVTESLSVLSEGVQIDISSRKSEIFRLPVFPARVVDTDASSIEYRIGSASSKSPLLSPPADQDVGKTQSVFVKISGATHASLQTRYELHLNEWKDNAKWVRAHAGKIRVEKCFQDEKLMVNNQLVDGSTFDYDVVNPIEELFIDSNGAFRVALASSEILPIKSDGYGLVFTAPSNARGSLYRATCVPGRDNAGQCEIEQSRDIIRGSPVACDPATDCRAPIPAGCDGASVSIVADKGPEYGMFSPWIPGDVRQGEAVSDSSGWVWHLLQLAVAWFVWRLWSDKKILIRIFLFKLIDKIRQRKFKEDLLETGSYHELKDRSRYTTGRTIGNTEMSNRSFLGNYYGG